MSFLALDKVGNFFRIVKQNGGVTGTIMKLFRQAEAKDGTFVGEDQFGNKYYQNPRYFMGRSRWVEYNSKVFLDFDASQVPPQWYGWLHYKTDMLPCNDCTRPHYYWILDYQENLSGTVGQYVPYSTTRPKVEPWDPSNPCKEQKKA